MKYQQLPPDSYHWTARSQWTRFNAIQTEWWAGAGFSLIHRTVHQNQRKQYVMLTDRIFIGLCIDKNDSISIINMKCKNLFLYLPIRITATTIISNTSKARPDGISYLVKGKNKIIRRSLRDLVSYDRCICRYKIALFRETSVKKITKCR